MVITVPDSYIVLGLDGGFTLAEQEVCPLNQAPNPDYAAFRLVQSPYSSFVSLSLHCYYCSGQFFWAAGTVQQLRGYITLSE